MLHIQHDRAGIIQWVDAVGNLATMRLKVEGPYNGKTCVFIAHGKIYCFEKNLASNVRQVVEGMTVPAELRGASTHYTGDSIVVTLQDNPNKLGVLEISTSGQQKYYAISRKYDNIGGWVWYREKLWPIIYGQPQIGIIPSDHIVIPSSVKYQNAHRQITVFDCNREGICLIIIEYRILAGWCIASETITWIHNRTDSDRPILAAKYVADNVVQYRLILRDNSCAWHYYNTTDGTLYTVC